MELKFERRKLNLDLYGEAHELVFPTSHQLDTYLDNIDKIGKGELEKTELGVLEDFLAELGLPKEATKNFEMKHLNELTYVLLDRKKK